MAKKKTTASTSPSNGDKQTITKQEAVRQILEKKGRETSAKDIQKLAKEQFGFDLTIAHIYNLKSTLSNEASGKKSGKTKGKRKGGRRKKPQTEAQPAAV